MVQYNFEGQYDIVKFIKMIAENGMYATLRVGPFIQAEWNYGYDSISLSLIYIYSFCILNWFLI